MVGGGVGFVGLEKVANPIGLEERFNKREFKVDLGPMEELKAEPDGELFPDED